MSLNIINARSLSRVIIQNTGDQVSSLVRDRCVIGEAVLVASNSLIGCLDIVSFKWRLADNKSVNNDSQGPDINLVRMSLFALKNFWRNIVGSTADGSFALSIELKLGGETEISHFDFHLVVKEKVTEFQISMNNAMGV
jgi:hypothetical protein